MTSIERTRPQAKKDYDPRKQDHGTRGTDRAKIKRLKPEHYDHIDPMFRSEAVNFSNLLRIWEKMDSAYQANKNYNKMSRNDVSIMNEAMSDDATPTQTPDETMYEDIQNSFDSESERKLGGRRDVEDTEDDTSLDSLYSRAAEVVNILNTLPRTTSNAANQLELDRLKDELEAELESIKEDIDYEEGFSSITEHEAGGRSTRDIRDSMARSATLDTYGDDAPSDYTGDSPIRIRNSLK